ncbi:zinc ribbon domain-containing protein [Salinithrix halophila]|uniref:Zinc ribbon domain-containing protein n=1 Tax=Salinithrix halophila TaxID=1485204 RepID=A0ABV8JN32_9BACL
MTESRRPNGCPKCGSRDAQVGSIATTGAGLSRFFDLQHNQFQVVSCKNCGYSEFYRKKGSTAATALDLFFGG